MLLLFKLQLPDGTDAVCSQCHVSGTEDLHGCQSLSVTSPDVTSDKKAPRVPGTALSSVMNVSLMPFVLVSGLTCLFHKHMGSGTGLPACHTGHLPV